VNASGQKDPASSRVYMTDALNSVIAQLSDEGNASIQTSYSYSPYGESQSIGPDGTNNPTQYTSRENDGTGLYYYRARYCDPILKRFVSRDPIGLAGGMNDFAYVGGNPIGLVDRRGLAGEKIDGNRVTVHKNDVDPWPSDPHGHIYDKNQVVDRDGKIYDKTTGKQVGQLSKKGLEKWFEFLKRIGKLGLVGDLILFKELVDQTCAVAMPGNPFCSPPPLDPCDDGMM
jgi:RHS repeat-associated protein